MADAPVLAWQWTLNKSGMFAELGVLTLYAWHNAWQAEWHDGMQDGEADSLADARRKALDFAKWQMRTVLAQLESEASHA